jgi:hypothetical protein
MEHEEFEQRLKKSKSYFKSAFKEIPDERKKIKMAIVDQLAFVTVNLNVLQDDIIERGPIVLFEQGSQKMWVENPAQKSYVAMVNRWTALINQLNMLLPKEVEQVELKSPEEIIKLFKGGGE